MERVNWPDSQVLEQFPARGAGKRHPGRFGLGNVRQVVQPGNLPCQGLAQRSWGPSTQLPSYWELGRCLLILCKLFMQMQVILGATQGPCASDGLTRLFSSPTLSSHCPELSRKQILVMVCSQWPTGLCPATAVCRLTEEKGISVHAVGSEITGQLWVPPLSSSELGQSCLMKKKMNPKNGFDTNSREGITTYMQKRKRSWLDLLP